MKETPQNKVSISIAVEVDGLTIGALREFLATLERAGTADTDRVWVIENDNSGPDRIEVFC